MRRNKMMVTEDSHSFMMPRNLEAETALLSLAFLSSDMTEVFEMLEPSDFYETTHQQIWQAIIANYESGHGIDVVVIQDELKKQNLDAKSAMQVVLSVFESPTVFGGNAKKFAHEIKNAAILRRLLTVLEGANQQAQVSGSQPRELITELEKNLIELSEEVIDKRPQDSDGILDEVEVDIENTRKNGWKAVQTQIPALDEVTGGFIPTHVWIVGAYTGTGKTFFLVQMILNILKQGKTVMMISTEMDRKMIMLRLLGNLCGIKPLKIMRGQLDDYELEQLDKAKQQLRSYKNQLFIVDNVYTTHEIRLKAKKVKLETGNLDVLMVDFIQNLQGQESIYERMSQAAIDLQEMAQSLNTTVVIASQVSQQGATRFGKDEVIEYKGAGEIAAIADVGLWITKYKPKEAEKFGFEEHRTDSGGVITYRKLLLRKVRHGEPGVVDLRMDFPAGTVTQVRSGVTPPVPEDQTNVLETLTEEEVDDDFEP